MRDETEMMRLILNTAERDDRIRAVILNGSRANPRAPQDRYRDFDVVYVVTDVDSFRGQPDWVDVFGERLIMQLPEEMKLETLPPNADGSYIYLMQFTDGNRIDLTLVPQDYYERRRFSSLSVVLLDKDNRIPTLPPPDESDYLVQPPTEKTFADCCNEFWWVSLYVGKGVAREELIYAQTMLNASPRDMLIRMLCWYAGINSGFHCGFGKYGKDLQRCIPQALFEQYAKTYAAGSISDVCRAAEAMCALFFEVSRKVAFHFRFCVPSYAESTYRYLHNMLTGGGG